MLALSRLSSWLRKDRKQYAFTDLILNSEWSRSFKWGQTAVVTSANQNHCSY